MPAFHVFVDGPVDASPNATTRLAEAMAKRYGLPSSELSTRLARGRFRVKSNVDRATADAYVKDLTALGARVSIEEIDTGHAPPGAYRAARVTADPIPNTNLRASQQIPISRSERAATPPAGVPRTATPPAGVARTVTPVAGVARTATPPAGVARTVTPVAGVARTATPPAGVATPDPRASASGLAAARESSSGLAAAGGANARGRASTPASGLAAAGVAPGAPARPSSTGLAAAGSALRSSSPSIPVADEPRAATASNPPAFSSGLSAAFSGEAPLDLGALGDDQLLSLSSVDGASELPDSAPASFAPPGDVDVAMDEPMPASIGPAVAPARPTPVPARTSQPLDLFAPPEAADDAATDFAIADERPARPSAPPATAAPAPAASARISQPILVQPDPTATTVHRKPAMPRNRFLAGVVLAIALGFVPAHFIGASRESAAYGEIDRKVQQYQADPTVSDDEVTAFRSAQLDAKKSKRTTIALTSLLVWAAASAAFAYLWFRRIPWDRVDGQASR